MSGIHLRRTGREGVACKAEDYDNSWAYPGAFALMPERKRCPKCHRIFLDSLGQSPWKDDLDDAKVNAVNTIIILARGAKMFRRCYARGLTTREIMNVALELYSDNGYWPDLAEKVFPFQDCECTGVQLRKALGDLLDACKKEVEEESVPEPTG